MRNLEMFLKGLEEEQKGARAHVLTKEVATEVYNKIVNDFESMNEVDKKRFEEYSYSETVGDKKWGTIATVITAFVSREGEFKVFADRKKVSDYQRTGLNKKMRMLKKDGTVGIKMEWEVV